jgi:DNA polymerase III subunit gamma/tau
MPDFFDRLIARGTQQPGGGTPAPGQPGRRASGASDSGSGASVAFALPRLPGPFEGLATGSPDPFLEAVDETWEVDAARPQAPLARPALGGLAGTQAAITPSALLRDSATPRVPGRAPAVPGEQPPASPAPPQPAPLLPTGTPVHLAADAGAAAPDQASARASRPPGGNGGAGSPSVSRRGLGGIVPPRQAGPARVLAVPASAVRAARPAADEARIAQAPPPAPPPVMVRIGRIEVRNWGQDRREPQPKRRASRAAPKQTLAAYLAAANGGRTSSGVWPGGAR